MNEAEAKETMELFRKAGYRIGSRGVMSERRMRQGTVYYFGIYHNGKLINIYRKQTPAEWEAR